MTMPPVYDEPEGKRTETIVLTYFDPRNGTRFSWDAIPPPLDRTEANQDSEENVYEARLIAWLAEIVSVANY